MIKIILGLYDPSAFNNKQEKYIEDIKNLKKRIIAEFGEDEQIINYISGIAFINLLLIEKKDLKGWEEIYMKFYYQYLERVDELIQIVMEIKSNKHTILERLKEIKNKIQDQMIILNVNLKSEKLKNNVQN